MTATSGRDIYLPETATLVRNRRLTELERLFEIQLDSGAALGHMPGSSPRSPCRGSGKPPFRSPAAPT